MAKMSWLNCFSSKRYGDEPNKKTDRTAFERDWDRIIFSSPFRRLQNKTQVFPLPNEVFVHNRLTHSLEVASVGRSLGTLVGDKIGELEQVAQDMEAFNFYKNNLKNVISAACLAHDLGNPAFGHSGEEAISKYFLSRDTNKPEDQVFKALFSDAEWKDLCTFEGNANAFRILTLQQKGRFRGGFRLTYSTLGAILKYPCESLASQGKKGPLHRKKFGYFKIDEEVFLEVVKELNMEPESEEKRVAYKRHPFVYLVEAADDICYNIVDFEDAHRLGILSYETVRKQFEKIIEHSPFDRLEDVQKTADQLSIDKNESLAYLRAKAINVLTILCARCFYDQREAILAGNFANSLIDSIAELQPTLEEIKEISLKQIYNARSVIELELAGFKIIAELVKDFVSAALAEKKDTEQKNLLALMPHQYGFDQDDSPYTKVMHVIDYISGMTDVYALKLYRKIRGIEV